MKHGVKNMVNDNEAFYKAEIYVLINEFNPYQHEQQTSYDRKLRKILKLFQSPELTERLEYSEREAYNQYLKPLIEIEEVKNKKRFPFLSGIFIASLIASLSTEPFMYDIVRDKLADDTLSDEWIDKIEKNENNFIELYANYEHSKYQNEKEKKIRETTKASDKITMHTRLKNINEEYCESETSYKYKWYELNKEVWIRLLNLNSICYKLVMINFEKKDNIEYQEKLEYIVKTLNCLPVDRKDMVFNKIKVKIDYMEKVLNHIIEDWDNDTERALKDEKTKGHAIAEFREFELLRQAYPKTKPLEYDSITRRILHSNKRKK